LRLVKSNSHIGSLSVNSSMERFIAHRTQAGVPIFNLEHTYNKIKLAARIIAGIRSLEDVMVVSSRDYGQRAVIKFGTFTGCSATSNARWTPGILTNYQTKKFQEPRLMVVVDTFADRKAIIESSYMNIPVIALTNTDSNLQYVDVAIPCNNKSTESISMIFWLLAREVLVLRGQNVKNEPWEVPVDLFYFKTLEEAKKYELALQETDEVAEGDVDEDSEGEGEGWEDNEDGEEWGGDQ